MPITCTRCEGTGFINLHQIPENDLPPDNELIDEIPKWIASHSDHDVSVCDCCGDGNYWYGFPGEHYNIDDPQGIRGPYSYNGGLCECH